MNWQTSVLIGNVLLCPVPKQTHTAFQPTLQKLKTTTDYIKGHTQQ